MKICLFTYKKAEGCKNSCENLSGFLKFIWICTVVFDDRKGRLMKILYVASEASPYAASGGLGDVLGSLPAAVIENDEQISASVIIPLYDTIKSVYRDELVWVADINFSLSWRSTGATVYSIKRGGVDYYFIDNYYYFDRGRLYGEFDDGERFAFFSMAAIEFILATGNIPDILHANDWQAALSVIYLKTIYSDIPLLSSIKTIYTIHNIEYQGKYDLAILGDVFALQKEHAPFVEYDGCINLMKGAITLSDFVSTVSPNYANELRYDFFAFGLSEVIRSAENKICGIINGIDYSYFSPDLGGDIYFPYTRRAYKSGKAKNKAALQRELGLHVEPAIPLLVMITRLTAGKGIDLVLHIAEELLQERVQVVILGTGEAAYEDAFRLIEKKHSNFKALMKFDRVFSKKIYAAADIFIMPSKSEPCGLAQMIACSYGAIPVVRAVGGLYDSIRPYGADGSLGFVFENYNAHELLYTLKSALTLYDDKKEWSALVRRAITKDFSWKQSAAKYISLYKNLLKR